MNHRQRTILASGCVVALFLVVQIGALALVEPFQQEGHQFVEDTEDPSLSIFYILAIFTMTAIMLAAFKYGGDSIIRLVIIFAGVYIAYFVLQVLVPEYLTVTIGSSPVDVLAVVGALVLGAALYFYPEWYVINASGVLMGIGAAGLFGINLNIFPVIVLLVLLAIYDAISVYRTKHMLTLASGAMKIRVPVVFVIPLSLSYSFIEDGGPSSFSETEDEGLSGSGDDNRRGSEDNRRNGADGTTSESAAEAGHDMSTETTADSDTELDADRLTELGPEGISNLEPEQLVQIDDQTKDALDEDLRQSIEDAIPRRDALFIGLGDAVMPTILVASAAFFVGGSTISILGISANLPAITAMGGTMVGLVILLWLVTKGRAHAGLPLLNGGAIAGYLVGALVSGLSLVEALGLDGII